MENMKGLNKVWLNSLGFLDNGIVHCSIVTVLILYCSTIFDNINGFVGNLYNFSLVRLAVLLLILYFSKKDLLISLLLALSYVVSLHYMSNNEYFVTPPTLPSAVTPPHLSKQPVPQQQQPLKKSEPQHERKPVQRQEQRQEQELNEEDDSVPKHHLAANAASVHAPTTLTKPPSPKKGPSQIKEHFFPLMNQNDTGASFDRKKSVKGGNGCMANYVPKFESVGDVCNPAATFQGQLNTQGLNIPEGFGSNVMGAPMAT